MSKPYPRHYAVDDRPVVISERPDGEVDCLGFDAVTGNLSPDRRYLAALAPGSGHDVVEVTAADHARLVEARRAELLRTWCERLCRAEAASAEHLLAALGTALRPPPLGASAARIHTGQRPEIQLALPAGTMTRAALDARFGVSQALPPADARAPHLLVYQVTVPGGWYRCSLLATFAAPPEPSASASGLALRLDREHFARDERGWTPLFYAAERGLLPVVEDLIFSLPGTGFVPQRLGYLEMTDRDGRTAADVAEQRGHREIAERLRHEARRMIDFG